MKVNLLLKISIFLISITAAAQVNFETSVSKKKLGKNQRFRIEFSVNKQGADDFEPPLFSNFKVISGPSSSTSQVWSSNAGNIFKRSYIYVLQPLRVGRFTIPSASISYEGRKIKSNSVQITVTKAVEVPKDPNDPYHIANENIHIVAELSKSNPYIGEGVSVTYKVYVSEAVSVHNWAMDDLPQFNGFWSQDLDTTNEKVRKTKYKGKNYRFIIIKKAILIPHQGGVLKIDPVKVTFNAGIPTGRADFFGNVLTKNINHTATSKTLTFNVKELPETGKPVNFTGAVGRYEMTMTKNKEQLKANEAAQVKIKITGRGNMKFIELPKINTPPELEVFDPEHKESISTSSAGFRGTISDEYTVVPRYKGKYKIPEVNFSFFDPAKRAYKSISCEPLYIDVTEGKERVSLTDTEAEMPNQKTAINQSNNFRYILLSTQLKSSVENKFLNTSSFYWLLLGPFLLIPIAIFLFRRRKKLMNHSGNKARKANLLAKRYLSKASKLVGNEESFYIALEKALHNYLKAKLKIETSEMEKDNIQQLLIENKVDKQTTEAFISVLAVCELARYTPTTRVVMKQDFEKAKNNIAKIDSFF